MEDVDGKFVCFVDEESAREIISSGWGTLYKSSRERWVHGKKKSTELGIDPSWLLGSRLRSAFDQVADRERKELLGEWCKKLTHRQRNLIRMRYHEDLTFPQISLAMQITESAALKLHRRTLDELDARLAKARIRRLEHI